MTHTLRQAILVLCAFASLAQAENPPKRLPRSQAFLGIHFDFHAGPDCKEVGKNTTKAMVDNIIDLVHPDYLQIDCKGHPGYSSYPTKVGNPVPGFVGDPLKVWREATAARGVGLYMHYSGVWDSRAVALHPDWAAIGADGKPSTKATSVFGPYAEKLLIPQLRELAGDYGVDGIWVDGECWATVPDYGPAAVAAFQKATGLKDVPRKPTDPNWFEFRQFHREAFRVYLRNYIEQVKKTHPSFQICSNWAYTDHMAEPVSAPLDFLSGDYSPQDSVNSARLSARYLARQGQPWDLMAWSFSTQPDRRQKSAIQLQREAAIVLAQGGGFQAYFKQKRDGSIFDEQMPVMGEVAKFCRARQAIVHHQQGVPQVALVFSTADQYRRIKSLFGRELSRINGALQALLETQHSVEALGEHQLTGRLADYPLIILPEVEYLEPAFRDSLAAYVKEGGNLLLIGPSAARLFEKELNAKFEGDIATGPIHLAHAGAMVSLNTPHQLFPFPQNARVLGQLHASADPNSPAQPAAFILPYGKGQIAATRFSLGHAYLKGRPPLLRQFLSDLARELFPSPLVTLKGSPDVELAVARNHDKLLVNLINTSGPHATQSILENITPLGPINLSIRLDKEPASVTLEPGNRKVESTFKAGQLHLTIPKVDVYEILVIHPR